MKKFILAAFAALALAAALPTVAWADAASTVTVTKFHQSYPYSGRATVEYTVGGTLPANAVAEFTINTGDASATFTQNSVVAGANTNVIDFASSFGGALVLTNASFTVTITEGLGGVQLWENGPYWAECNVGASEPEEYGYYFWWGDTVGYTYNGSEWVSVEDGTSITFFYYGAAASTLYFDESLLAQGYIDSAGNLVAAHDAATAHLGAPWRMPTDGEFRALIENCTYEWITTNGVPGELVTGKGDYADRSIFLPGAGYGRDSSLKSLGTYGYCWSSTRLDTGDTAIFLHSGLNASFFCGGTYRCYGLPVRPVREFAGCSAGGVVTRDPEPIVIGSVADWDALSAAVAGGLETEGTNVLLACDVGPVATTVGTAEHPFAGVFDGGSNTLTVALSGSDRALAPFFRVSGATIRNLKVAGTVSGAIHCSGLVGEVVGGPNLIEDCEVAAAISSSESHFGGFIGHSVTYAATLRGCVFSGSLSGGTYVATFNGWSDDGATTTLIDCLDASTSNQPIGRGADAACVSNTYYLTTKNFSNGERLWSEGKRGKRAWSVTPGEGVTIGFGAPAATYGTTGITAYPPGMARNDTFYAAEGEVVLMELAASLQFGMTVYDYRASAGTLSQNGNIWALTMPGGPVVVNANTHGKVRLWEGGPYWTETNLGADEPWESGYYFWWGDTIGYKRENNAWVAGDGSGSPSGYVDTPTYGKDYATLLSNEWITAEGVLAPAHDAAQAHWGSSWRMPTYQDLFYLYYYCDWTWTTTNGVSGYIVRGRGNFASRSIFLPAAGYSDGTSLYNAGRYGSYWSSVPSESNADSSSYLLFSSDSCSTYNNGRRDFWYSVRPVWTTPTEITISSSEGWNAFARSVNEDGESYAGRTVILAADIGPVTVPVGTSEHPFDGTFDGAGHALTVAINGATPFAAPFAVVRGATIKNLIVRGTVRDASRAAGLVGTCDGQAPTVLLNCAVEADIGGFSGFAGGLVGWCGADAPPLAITNCFFTGSFTPDSRGVWHPVACKDASAAPSASVQGAYYLNTLAPNAPAANVVPDAEGSPLNATFVVGDWARPVTAPDGTTYYLATQRTITISTTEEWKAFARSLNDAGESYAERTVTLAADISIGGTMVGTADHPFNGTFDGAGHTLDVNLGAWGDIAPFSCISGATIKRVKTTGSIDGRYSPVGGIVARGADGSTNLILNCWSDVKMFRRIVWIGGDKVGCGGIIGNGGTSSTTVRNCLFTGVIANESDGDGDHYWAYAPSEEIGVVGLIYGWGEAGGAHRVENCLVSGADVSWVGYRYSGRTEILACADGAGTLSNSYHWMVAGHDPVCPTQGVDAVSMSAADLAAALGDGWHLSDKVALPVGLEAIGGLDLGTCFGGTRPFDLTEGIVLYLVPSLTTHGRAPDRSSWYSIVDPMGAQYMIPSNLVTSGGVSLTIGKDYRIVTTSAVGGTRGTTHMYRVDGLYFPSSEYLPGNAYEETVTLVGIGANTGTLKVGTFMAGYVPDEDKVEISSPAMFRAFAGWVNFGYSVNAVLTADLAFDPDDLIYDTDGDGVPDANFRPIGTAEHPFGATFDGAGHKITGLRCRDGAAAGLFAYNQGTVAGVVLEDAVLSATNAVGGIAAVNNGTVERCVVADAELSVSSGGALGAIVGTGNGTLARNFYDGCSVASAATPSGIGTASGDVDGARPGIRVCGAGNVNVAGVHSASSCGAGSNNRVYGGAGESLVVTLDTPDVRSDSYTAIGGTIAYSGIEVDNSGRPLGPYRYTISIPADAALGHVVTVNRDNLWGVNEGCDGTPEHPYVIRSPAGLDLLADVVNNDSSPLKEQTDDYDVFKRRHLFGVFFELGADIVYPHETAWNDASSTENNYTPIGLTESQPFDGHFDGKGHTISGIRMYDQNLNGSNNHYGIFGAISYGEVKNVTVADTRITYIGEVGGVVGGAFDRGVIANCHVKGDVCINGFARSYYHGGVAGYLERNSIISHCTSAVKITQSGDGQAWGHFGGIVGGSEDSSISHCLVVDAVIPATDDNHQGAVTVRRNSYGGLDKNRLDHNYYADCTVAGKTADVGCCIYTNYHAGVVFYGDLNDADNPDGAVPAIILREGNANAGVLAGNVGQTTNVALYALATAKDGEWNTLCLPFAVGDRAGTPLEGFAVKEFASATAAGGTLRLNFSDASAGVVSGRPCAVKKCGERVVADAANVGFVFIKGAGNYYAVMAPPYGIIESSHDCLVDGSTNTMWCADRGMYADSVQSWYYDEKYRKHYYRACEFAAVRAVNVTGYTLVTGYDTHDDPSRNPVNWTLKAKRNLSDAWTVLDSRDVTVVPADALPGENCAEKSYGIAAGLRGEYRYFRFEMNDYLVGYSAKWEGTPEAALRRYSQLSEFKLQGTYEADAPLGAAAFAGVTIGNVPAATVGGADGKVDFVGGYEPVVFASGDRGALLLGSDGALAYPAAATTLGAGQAWFRLNGLQAVRDVTGYTLDFGDEILSGVFSLRYADWAALHGLGAWDAADARGIHNVFRYAFNVPTGDFALLGIAFNDDGKAVILTPPLVNTSGFTFSVVVSDNVNGTGNSATYDLDASGETVINETGKSRRFFRLRAVEQ